MVGQGKIEYILGKEFLLGECMAEQNEKIDGGLNLALQIPRDELEQSSNLQYGYQQEARQWQIIVKYIGDVKRFEEIFQDTRVIELLN